MFSCVSRRKCPCVCHGDVCGRWRRWQSYPATSGLKTKTKTMARCTRVALLSISLCICIYCFCLRNSFFVTQVCAKVCDEDVGFSATLLSAHAGEAAECHFIRCCIVNVFRRTHYLADAVCRLLPLHGRTKLLQLVRDIYHRFHVLHCSAGVCIRPACPGAFWRAHDNLFRRRLPPCRRRNNVQ